MIMLNKYWKYIIAALFGTATGLLSTTWAVVPTPDSPLNITSQELGLSGPLSLGINYDSLSGAIVNAQWAQALSPSTALGLLGEYGKDQYRLNGTFGYQPYSAGLLKFSAEYLSQLLPFSFESGDINQRVSQSAFGVNFQHEMNQNVLQNLNVGAYWAKSPNTSLSTLDFMGNGNLDYTNQRHIAGAVSDGISMGGTIDISSMTSLDAGLNYDSVNYNTEWVSSSVNDTRGIGETLKLNQIINENTKFSIGASNRALYDTYGLNVNFSPSFLRTVGMTIAASFQRLVSSNATPSSNTYGLEFNFLGNAGVISPHFSLNKTSSQADLTQWIKTPAVYMQRVMAVAEQITTLNAPEINSISPQVGLLAGNNTVSIQGSNFVSGTKVMFGAVSASSVSLVSAHEISVTVPAVDKPQTVSIAIINPDGKETVLENGYRYVVSEQQILPILTSITSSSGSILGGDKVTLIGKNFADIKTVTFDGIPATKVTLVDNTTVTAITPKHVAGVVNIALSEATGDTVLSRGYNYYQIGYVKMTPVGPVVTNITPPDGAGGATPVVINGSGFSGDGVTVNFGATAAGCVVSTDTSINCMAPVGGSGLVDVTVLNGTRSAASAADQFTFSLTSVTPTVTVVSPNSGSTTGGDFVTITGTNFDANTGSTSVNFGTNLAIINSINTTSITVTSPAVSSAGVVDITVTTTGGGESSKSLPDHYTYIPAAPTISSVSPNSGPTVGGQTVTITGTGLGSATAVNFGMNAGSIVTDSPTSITAASPAGTVGTVDVTVTTAGGTSVTSSSDRYTYVAVPTVSGVSPNSGPKSGGQTVIITGAGLGSATAVNFGGNAGTIDADSATSITATSPATGTAGTVDVTVTTAGGTSATSSSDHYTYVAAPTVTGVSPNSGPTSGGQTVIITGTDLTGATAVSFGSTPATSYVVNNDNAITAISSAGSAATVDIRVTTAGGASAISSSDHYNYIAAAPTVTSVSPNIGSTGGGTSATISGANFTGATAVNFGANPAISYVVNDDNSITAISSTGSAGVVDITITTAGGTSSISSADQFTYETPVDPSTDSSSSSSNAKVAAAATAGAAGVAGTAVAVHEIMLPKIPTITSVSPNIGSFGKSTPVVIKGKGFAHAKAVKFGNMNAANFTVNSDTQIIATAPTDLGTVNITVVTSKGSSVVSSKDEFTYKLVKQ
jgi:hypothetical protein